MLAARLADVEDTTETSLLKNPILGSQTYFIPSFDWRVVVVCFIPTGALIGVANCPLSELAQAVAGNVIQYCPP